MKISKLKYIPLFSIATIVTVAFIACSNDSNSDEDAINNDDTSAELHAAFAEFDSENVTILLNGTEVEIETNGMPNHTSPYWSNTTERSAVDPMGNTLTTEAADSNHPLFVEPTVTSFEKMAPGNIDDFNGSYSLTVPQTPTKAPTSTSTGLGAIGIAVSGAMIYNDEEGPNVPLDDAVGSLDYTAAHTGPQSYHYHLETKAWSNDDENLIGIMADGFFLYGRKCNATGTYPTDLDASGGHTSTTQHSTEEEYHYHIQNELYLNQFYILFPGDYQGTPATIL
ncbi:YHYH protein [Cellulophaga lytica]|uniref:YHYH protein n=1 Tax=Cellulophaga lytica TaxID=979 RepID=UPI0004F7C857|nr:YHYH protein [Cellulophaga lytica]AIM61653.1 membrane protein [Cellulophaga lytica]